MVYDIYLFVEGKLMKLLMTRLRKDNLFMPMIGFLLVFLGLGQLATMIELQGFS